MQYQALGATLRNGPTAMEFGLSASVAERERGLSLLESSPRPLLGVIFRSSWPRPREQRWHFFRFCSEEAVTRWRSLSR